MEKELIKIADDAFNGNTDPIEAFVQLKRFEKKLKECIESVQPLAIKESYSKYSEKTFDAFGARIEKKRAAGSWDFSAIESWNNSKAKIKAIEEMSKAAYQSSLKSIVMTDDSTGEIIQPASFKEGADTISIKIL